MTRPKKQHRPGGIHYVVLFGNGGQEIFQDEADKENFVELLSVARSRCNAEIFAFCLTRRDARLVVRVSDVPVGRLVQRVATQYSRNNHAKYATAGYLFQHPYRAYLLEGTTHLLEIVRHVHRAPLELDVTEDLDGYRWCSHRAYLGLGSLEWLNPAPVRELFAAVADTAAMAPQAAGAPEAGAPSTVSAASGGALGAGIAADAGAAARVGGSAGVGVAAGAGGFAGAGGAASVIAAARGAAAGGGVSESGGGTFSASGGGTSGANGVASAEAEGLYRQFMAGPPEGTGSEDQPPRSQLPSDDHFFSWLRRHAGKPPATVTVDQVIQAVAKKMGVDRKRLLSTSRERRLTLTRALIGWHVTKNQIATLTEVSRQLGRDPSSVYTAYARYRAWRPQLFRDSLATILQYLENDDTAAAKKH